VAIDRDAPEALFVWPGGVTITGQARIIDFAAQRQLPAMYHQRAWAAAGGLMSYGNRFAESHRRAATYVDRILRGAKPGDLPIESPTQYELVINLKTADTLGLSIPDSLLSQASEVLR
jgi:putative ABC transport system substrate-binding protein